MNLKYRIYLKSFSEYCYRILKSLSAEQKKAFSLEELKIINNGTALSDFTSKEQLDRLLLALTKTGKIITIRICDDTELADNLEYHLVDQYEFPEKKVDIITKMAKENIFYMSSNDIVLSTMMGAQNVNSPVYQLAVNSRQLVDKISSVRSLKIPFDEQVEKSVDAYNLLNAMLLQQLNSFDWALSTLGLEQNEIRILAALFVKKHGVMSLMDLSKGTLLQGKKAYLKKNLDKLMKAKMVLSDAKFVNQKGKRTVFYMIGPEGIRKIMQYNNYIHEQTFGS